MTDTANKYTLLTGEERNIISPFYDVAEAVYKMELPTEAAKIAEFKRICREFNYDIDSAKKLATRFIEEKWFCVFPSGALNGGDFTGVDRLRPFVIMSYYTSDIFRENKIIELTPIEDYYDIYAIIQDSYNKSLNMTPEEYVARLRDALGLSSEYLFVSDDDATTLYNIFEAYTVTKRPGRLAAEQGAIMSIGGRLTFPSAKGFEKSFTRDSIKNIKPLPGREKEFKIDEITGEITTTDAATFEEVATIDGAFIAAIMSCMLETDGLSQSIKISVPRLCNELKIDPRKYSTEREKDTAQNLPQLRYEALYKDHIAMFENFGGFINGTWYRIMTLSSYDPTSEVITIHAPYISKLIEILSEHSQQTHRNTLNRLLESSVANEQNKTAVELANLIIIRVLQLNEAGRRNKQKKNNGIAKKTIDKTKTDGSKVTVTLEYNQDEEQADEGPIVYRTLYSTLIADCPQLKRDLAEIDNGPGLNKAQRYNTKLKQTFEAAFRIILQKSLLPQKYLNLRINGISEWESTYPRKKGERRRAADFKIPTRRKIGTTKLIITHNGLNPDFQANNPD